MASASQVRILSTSLKFLASVTFNNRNHFLLADIHLKFNIFGYPAKCHLIGSHASTTVPNTRPHRLYKVYLNL